VGDFKIKVGQFISGTFPSFASAADDDRIHSTVMFMQTYVNDMETKNNPE